MLSNYTCSYYNNVDELIFYPDEQTVMNSFGYLASLNIMWIPFKNGKDDEKVLFI